jgi:cobalt-zinc-cadmium efflux system protein
VESFLASLPEVNEVHDLHIWAMSTTEVALTVHLMMATPPRDDIFLHNLAVNCNHVSASGMRRRKSNAAAPVQRCHQAAAHVV